MNKAYWTIVVVFATVLLVGGFFALNFFFPGLLSSGSRNTNNNTQNGTTIPSNPSTVDVPLQSDTTNNTNAQSAAGLNITLITGSTASVTDFTKDPETKTTPNIPDAYFLSGGLEPGETGAPFSIMYVSTDQSFTISLWQEPIGEVRRKAETELLRKLGISQSAACALRYSVLVPNNVNPYYSGKNLGLSFCPGAAALQ